MKDENFNTLFVFISQIEVIYLQFPWKQSNKKEGG